MELEKLGTEPISPDKPAGEDIRYEPEFEELQAEIDKLSSPSASGGVDWKKVQELSASILAERSKDLLAAAYLSISLCRNQGIEGLAAGIQVMADMARNFWDQLYPPKKRKRGRIRILDWWIEKLTAEVERLRPFKVTDVELKGLTEALDELDRFLEEKLPEHPSTLPLIRLIEASAEVEQTEKAPEPAEEEAAGAEEAEKGPAPEAEKQAAAAPSAKAAAPAPEMGSAEEAKKALNSLLSQLKRASSLIRNEEPQNPLAYRLLRTALWVPVSAAPPSENGVTKIPPPPAQASSALTNLAGSQQWLKLLQASEANLVQRPFWLDLNRLSAQALQGLGPDYSQAARAVEADTVSLIRIIPELLELKFSDGTPLADDETRQWLSALSGASEGVPAGGPKAADPFQELFSKASALAAKQLPAALELLQQELARSPSAKDRFKWRILMVRLLVQAKKQHFAYAHINEIIKEIDEHRLEEWDPEIAFEGLQAAWMGLSRASDPAMKKRAREIVMRMSGLDTGSVLEIIRE